MLVDLKQLGEATAEIAAAPLWSLADDEVVEVLRAAHRWENMVAALKARVVHQADILNLPRAQNCRSTATWLGDLLLIDPSRAKELTRQATALSRRPVVEQAVLDGRMDMRQAQVIADTVEAIPADLSAFDDLSLADVTQIAGQAEAQLIHWAGRLPAYQLSKVGTRILAHVAPEVADRADEVALARQEARAFQRRGFTLSSPVDGAVRLSGVLGLEDAATVQAALLPLCTPITDDDRSPAQRRADALAEVCQSVLRGGGLPEDGGEPAQVTVTVAYDAVTCVLGRGVTDTGLRLSAATMRRMACDARILPVVLGGAGQVLDIGRTRRLATGALRRALHARDRGCSFPDCDRPPRWTDCHHVLHWAAGGATRLDNLVLLCRRHHRVIHDPRAGWQIRMAADGLPEFIPPATVDPDQVPRRNLYHLRR